MRKPAFCICENHTADQVSSHLLWLYSPVFVEAVYDSYVKLEDFSFPPSRREFFSSLDHFRTQGALKVDTIMNA